MWHRIWHRALLPKHLATSSVCAWFAGAVRRISMTVPVAVPWRGVSRLLTHLSWNLLKLFNTALVGRGLFCVIQHSRRALYCRESFGLEHEPRSRDADRSEAGVILLLVIDFMIWCRERTDMSGRGIQSRRMHHLPFYVRFLSIDSCAGLSCFSSSFPSNRSHKIPKCDWPFSQPRFDQPMTVLSETEQWLSSRFDPFYGRIIGWWRECSMPGAIA